MRQHLRPLLLLSGLLITSLAFSQVRIGGKLGANYAAGSQKIQPDPKNPPTNPKGLGMQFGVYAELPFSDLVGLRPELGFSFRRMKTELTISDKLENNTEVTNNQGAYTGTRDYVSETDQRLNYFQLNAPLTIRPAEGFRVMFGPSFNFLMGGKQNQDETTTFKGNVTGQNQQGQQVTIAVDQQDFTTAKRKGSAATKDFRKTDVMAMAGLGYTLPIGFDMDLRYYRSLSTTYDRSAGSERHRIWTNLIEFSLGWTFGG